LRVNVRSVIGRRERGVAAIALVLLALVAAPADAGDASQRSSSNVSASSKRIRPSSTSS
jgi:hypothetical protein